MLHDISMREVRLQYDGATLMNTQIKEQITRITRMTLLGTVYRDFQNSCIHQMVDIEMAKGVDLEEINEIPFLKLHQHIHMQIVGGKEIHTVIVRNNHETIAIGGAVSDAYVVSGSNIGRSGSTLILRGTPSGITTIVNGFKKWNKRCKISVVRPVDEKTIIEGTNLTEKQLEVFNKAWEMGFYEKGSNIKTAQVADSLGIARVTVSGHLKHIEEKMALLLARRLGIF
jgi:predicted DNA binding protein